MTFINNYQFHGYLDQVKGQEYNVKHFIIQERELSYRFYPHFHPYVAELVRRLIEKSVSGLQDADTDYLKNDSGIFQVLPESTLVALSDGTPVNLPDGTKIKLPDDTVLTLPDGTLIALPDGTQITLIAATTVTLRDGSQSTVPANTPVTLIDCKPKPVLYEQIFSPTRYEPTELVEKPYPVKELDFTSSGAYSVYNWELFYHVPLTIAIHLCKNQRFDEAQQWFHLIFDPTDDSDGPTPERFWKVKPFQYTDVKLIEKILVNLSTGADPALWQDTFNCIKAWKDAPFRPHLVARYRQSAYMFKTVMAYLDNLIAWGDTLFRQDTRESINDATQVYVLAANILGQRPQAIPKKGSVRPQTYANLKEDLDEFGNTLVDLETDIPFDIAPHPNDAGDLDQFSVINSLGRTLYFCVPRNDKLLDYWDTVADRLFKIHNSLNIQGIFRQLPLFEPPIDPALLARATAAGLDIGAIVSGANQPLPLVRFQFLVQKAIEICQEVKSLGNNLLSAMEKEDNEAIAILRAKHERVILGMAETVKYSQWQEAKKSLEGLWKNFANAVQRYTYNERLLGKQENEIKNAILDLEGLDTAGLEKMKFKQGEPEVVPRDIEVDIAQGAEGITGGKMISSYELQELNLLGSARDLQNASGVMELVGSYLSLIPQFNAHGTPLGVGAAVGFGGVQLSKMSSMIASMLRLGADQLTYEATKSAKIGSYARRDQETAFQSNLAAGEITLLFKQLRTAQIREAIAKREWENHKQQMKHAEEIENFLKGEETTIGEKKYKKTSTQALYTWMKKEVKGLYGQCFQFAFDIAKKAERALQHELGDSSLSYLQFGYLAGKEGLLGAEKLLWDIYKMRDASDDLNQREYELTKHVSLLQVNPVALLQLRATGSCTVFLPEELFDMDCPGHYFRRIKSVAVSIPCVTGPYTSVNCTLRLLKSTIRKSPSIGDGYVRENAEDDRFDDHFGSMQAIVTSSAQSDSGMFETNLRDERYLPFEGSGVISEWQVELPADIPQFDYDTISDVILHIRYAAREGGNVLRSGATTNLTDSIDKAQMAGSVRLFSVRHEFPTEWAKFTNIKIEGETKTAGLTIDLHEEHYPFWSKGRLKAVKRVDIYAKTTKTKIDIIEKPDGTGKKDTLEKDTSLGGLLAVKLTEVLPLTKPTDKLTLYFSDNSVDDLWLAITWGKET